MAGHLHLPTVEHKSRSTMQRQVHGKDKADHMDNNSNQSNRVNLIESVKTPLGFFTLTVLVVEAILGIVAGSSQGQDHTNLVNGMIVLIFFLVVIVAGLAIFRPEAVGGKRPVANGSIQVSATVESNSEHASTSLPFQ